MTTISITIASVPDREDAVAELWLGDEQLGEVSRELVGGFSIELYSAPAGTPWKIPLDDLVAALEEAKTLLGSF
ncbi:MAG: hypothetical protein ACKVPX_03055 [Myxococcaceae bacterium]